MLDISNIYEGEIFCHPLCLIRIIGTTKGSSVTVTHIHNGTSNEKVFKVTGTFCNALLMLQEGENQIFVNSNSSVKRKVWYTPSDHNYNVRLIYVTFWDVEQFEGPNGMKKNINEAASRIQVGALLLQTYLAETTAHERFGRKTFQLERQPNGYPKVFNIQLPITLKEANELSEQALWQKIALEILSSPLGCTKCKYLAFYSGTRYSNPDKRVLESEKDVLELTKGHVSLGGGGLALVGTGGLYTWSPTVEGAIEAMRSELKVDTNMLMDFSSGRGTWGATYGTHLGSVIHELAHTLDLGHTSDGIMHRGFEDFHLFFTMQQSCNDYMLKMSNPMVNSLSNNHCHVISDFVPSTDVNIRIEVSPSSQNQISNSKLHTCDLPPTKKSPIFQRFKSITQRKRQVEKSTSEFQPKNIRQFEKSFSCKATWARPSIVLLAFHRWITGDTGSDIPTLKGSIVSSVNKIRLIELRDSSMTYIHHWEFIGSDPPAIVHIPWHQIDKWPDTPTVEILVLDDHGSILKTAIPKPV